MTNPIDAAREFLDSIEGENRQDFLMRVLWLDVTEDRMKEVMDAYADLGPLFEQDFGAYRDHPYKFKGTALKLRAFIDHVLDGYSEESEREALEMFRLMEENGSPSTEKFAANMKTRSAYYRTKLPEWEELKNAAMSTKQISRHADYLMTKVMSEIRERANIPRSF